MSSSPHYYWRRRLDFRWATVRAGRDAQRERGIFLLASLLVMYSVLEPVSPYMYL